VGKEVTHLVTSPLLPNHGQKVAPLGYFPNPSKTPGKDSSSRLSFHFFQQMGKKVTFWLPPLPFTTHVKAG